MIVSWVFKKIKGDFFIIGDKVDVIWHNGQHYDGVIKDIRPDDREIIVDNLVFELDEIKDIEHVN